MSELVGLLLAGGRGRRFDPLGEHNKLLALLPDGRPVVSASAMALCAALPKVLALLPASSDSNTRLLAEILRDAGCTILHVPDAELGMGHTLAAGVAASCDASGWLVQPADMPWLQAASCAAVAGALRDGARIAAPTYFGRRGHPVGFASSCREALLALQGDNGARELLQRWGVHSVVVDDAGVLRDIDTPGDLHSQKKDF